MNSTVSREQPLSNALSIAQKAPQYLENHRETASLFSATETQELWTSYEQLLLACLRTGDDRSAHLCLERLMQRFGSSNDRVVGLKGVYQEATAKNETDLEAVLRGYDEILRGNPTNMPITKRKVSLLKHLSRTTEAIKTLADLIEVSPTDTEAWAELSDLYCSVSMYPQATYCLEEILLIAPNAWNIHARLGDVSYTSAKNPNNNHIEIEKALVMSVRRYCRSIELCGGYLKGLYGLKLATFKLLRHYESCKELPDFAAQISPKLLEELNNRATSDLSGILNRRASEYDESEIISAKELLDRGSKGSEE